MPFLILLVSIRCSVCFVRTKLTLISLFCSHKLTLFQHRGYIANSYISLTLSTDPEKALNDPEKAYDDLARFSFLCAITISNPLTLPRVERALRCRTLHQLSAPLTVLGKGLGRCKALPCPLSDVVRPFLSLYYLYSSTLNGTVEDGL